MKKPRIHEWAWGDIGRRTVCGQTERLDPATAGCLAVVHDLGDVAVADRCKNCERMRRAIGTSKKLPGN